MSFDFLFAKSIVINMTVDNKADGSKHDISFEFHQPMDEEQFKMISVIEDFDEIKELSENADKIKEDTDLSSVSSSSMRSLVAMRKVVLEIVVTNFIRGSGYKEGENVSKYINKLRMDIRTDLITQFSEKMMEGFNPETEEDESKKSPSPSGSVDGTS